MNNNSNKGSRAVRKTEYAGEPQPKKPNVKRVMVSELRKGMKFIDPLTEEIVYVNFSDDECKALGPANGYTTTYIRKGDEMWNKPVDLK